MSDCAPKGKSRLADYVTRLFGSTEPPASTNKIRIYWMDEVRIPPKTRTRPLMKSRMAIKVTTITRK
ncbi:hypothetical protein IG631_23974 [Alternaria alternata]|nr:hypothetical protein IG631_23974 [Alternaria alternata]